jgi:hypothetical protein
MIGRAAEGHQVRFGNTFASWAAVGTSANSKRIAS